MILQNGHKYKSQLLLSVQSETIPRSMELNTFDDKHQDFIGLPSDQHTVRDK